MKKVLTVLIVAVAMFLSQGLFTSHKNIVVSADLVAEKNFGSNVFYTEQDGEKFNGNQSVAQNVVAGESHIDIELPADNIKHFRFDFGVTPGVVKLSNLVIAGEEVVSLNLDNFNYSPDVTEHSVDSGVMTISSNAEDPYIVYKEGLDIHAGTSVNWLALILLLVVYGFVSYKLVGYFYKKK